MKPIYRIMAAFMIIGATLSACSALEDEVESHGYTLSVEATKGSASDEAVSSNPTKGLEQMSDYINTFWASGDKVMTYSNGYGTKYGELTPNGDGTNITTLSGTIDEAPSEGSNLSLVFPRYPLDYTGQKGTLEDIAANFDYATASTTVTSVTGSSVSTSGATFSDQQAILKINLQTGDERSSFSATDLGITDLNGNLIQSTDLNGSVTYGGVNLSSSSAKSTFYVAMKSAGEMNLEMTAYNRSDGLAYTFSRDNVSFENGHYYPLNIKFTAPSTGSTGSGTGGAVSIQIGIYLHLSIYKMKNNNWVPIHNTETIDVTIEATYESDTLIKTVSGELVSWIPSNNTSGYRTFTATTTIESSYAIGTGVYTGSVTAYIESPKSKANHVYINLYEH